MLERPPSNFKSDCMFYESRTVERKGRARDVLQNSWDVHKICFQERYNREGLFDGTMPFLQAIFSLLSFLSFSIVFLRSFAGSLTGLVLKIGPTPFSFWHLRNDHRCVCSHINFQICSLHRWYATIFYSLARSLIHSWSLAIVSHFTCASTCVWLCALFLFTRNTKFPILQRCYMKGEMKCRSCTHVHAFACLLAHTINAFVCNLFLCCVRRLDYIIPCVCVYYILQRCVRALLSHSPSLFQSLCCTHSTKPKPFTTLCSLTLAFGVLRSLTHSLTLCLCVISLYFI